MREVSFVNKIRYEFNGGVAKRALAIGDVDNDEQNELVCASLQGDIAVYKGRDSRKAAAASNLGMITVCAIGDVINSGRNHLAVINMEGWLFIMNVEAVIQTSSGDQDTKLAKEKDLDDREKYQLQLATIYNQRMPANCLELLFADVDGDGQNELIIGLTDRVLRTYKWVTVGQNNGGKFVGLYKWEFADQIGSVSLIPNVKNNCQDIVLAQPGGTYAKIECTNIRLNDPASPDSKRGSQSGSVQTRKSPSSESNSDNSVGGFSMKSEYVGEITPEYHQLAVSKMRNHHISTEILGGVRDKKHPNDPSLIVIATLDGTLMLVNKDEIIWSLQVDHQLFALAALDSEESNKDPDSASSSSEEKILKPQYFVACAWNGKTYIIDQDQNYLRFKFDEAVSAFTAGNFFFDGSHHSCLAYATFNNQILLYYDVVSDSIRPDYLLDDVLNNQKHEDLKEKLQDLLRKLGLSSDLTKNESSSIDMYNLMEGLLYSLNDNELN